MAAHFFTTVTNQVTGKPVANASVYLKDALTTAGGSDLTLFSNEALSASLDNPLTTDSSGFCEAYLAEDEAVVEIWYDGELKKAIENWNFVGGTVSGDITALETRMDAAEVVTQDATVAAFKALTGAADKVPYFNGTDTMALADFTSAGRALLDDASAAAQATTLGLGTGDSPQFTGINLGHASDTTLTRASAGVLAVEGVNVVLAGAVTTNGVTMSTGKLLGRYSASTGAIQEITISTGLSLDGSGNLTSSGGSGNAWNLQWGPQDNEPPTSNYATLDSRNGHPVLDFDTTTQETAIFTGVLPADYGGAGVTVHLWVAATSATSGTIGFDLAFERIDASSLDIDADSFGSATTVTATTVPGTSGQVLKLSTNVSDGANMDSLAAGEAFRLRVRRDVSNDTATGDAELLRVMMVSQ